MRTIILCLTLAIVSVGIAPAQAGVSSVFDRGRIGEYTFTFPDTVVIGQEFNVGVTLTVHTLPNTNLPHQFRYFAVLYSPDPFPEEIGIPQGAHFDTLLSITAPGEYNFSHVASISGQNQTSTLGPGQEVFTIVAIENGPNGESQRNEGYGAGPVTVLGDHDLNGSGSLNVADVTLLIKFIFSGSFDLDSWPKPTYQNADINCDQRINIADITKLIGYLFGGTASLPCFAGGG